MQSNNQKNGSKKFTGTKIVLGALSVAGTFGLWNLFANNALDEVKPTPEPQKNDSNNGTAVTLEFPPIPTLVPIMVTSTGNNPVQPVSNPPASSLRQVVQPTPMPPVVNKPVFEQITINRPGSSNSAASSGSSR
jgi:hypothetical protein